MSETRNEPLFIAIDPGTVESAVVVFRTPTDICFTMTDENGHLESRLRQCCWQPGWERDRKGYEHLAFEMIGSYGMPVGDEVFQTCLWAGRFLGAFGGPYTAIKRHEIRQHLCHRTAGVNDSVIRQRLIDIYGGKAKAIGLKKTPGPLYEVKGDEWQALAVAVTWWEKFSEHRMAV